MDSRATTDLFNDDFSDLFSEANMDISGAENSLNSMPALISLLEGEASLPKKLETIQNLAHNFVPTVSIADLDEKLFQYLMPAVRDLVDDIFKNICRVLETGMKQQSNRALLQENLQMCIALHEVLDSIIEHILRNDVVDLSKIQNVPVNVMHTLLLTFQHCKESNLLYGSYLENVQEILLLFRAAQDVHTNLLKLLDAHVNFNCLLEQHICIVEDVLGKLTDISEVLVDMNLKTLADNWKGYMTLTQKLAEVLNRSHFKISKPLAFLFREMSRNLNNVLKMDVDQKAISQTLKTCNFFMRVVLKLFETFWPSLQRICKDVLGFLSVIFSFYPPYLRFRNYDERIVGQINSAIFACLEPFFDKLFCEPEFYKGCKFKLENFSNPGVLFLLTSSFRKVSTLIVERHFVAACDVLILVDLFFDALKENYCELFWDVSIPTANGNQPLYNENLRSIASIINSLQNPHYNELEVILLKNILHGPIWGTLLAADIWCSVLSKKPKLCYETLSIIIAKLTNLPNKPERVFLENFLRRLYAFLPENHRTDLVERFPPIHNLNVWKTLGFRNFPMNQTFMLESLLINVVEKLEALKAGRCSVDDFSFLCAGFEATASLSEENQIDFTYLLSVMVRMWDFEPDGDSVLFKQFLGKLTFATNNFMLSFENEHLLLILTKLKQAPPNFNMKIQTVQILKSLSTRSFKHSQEQSQLTTAISQIFRSLLLDKNPIVRQNTLETFFDFFNATTHKEVLQNAVAGEVELQKLVMNFIHRNVVDASMTLDEYFAKQSVYELGHKCPGVDANERRPGVKKFKTDGDGKKELGVAGGDLEEQVVLTVKKIRNDIKLLHKLHGKENVFEENVTEIVNILGRQIGYRI